MKQIIGWSPVNFQHDRTEYVYFIKTKIGDVEQIKIGRSYNVKKRIFQIRMELSPKIDLLATIPVIGMENACSLENHLHNHFKSDRSFGEWFNQSPDLLKFINEIKNVK